jgi:hypothetical protein
MADLLGTVLVRAAFDGGDGPVEFPVGHWDVQEQYDVIEHYAPRRDGADLQTNGRRARRGTLEVPLLNDIGEGELFTARYFDLLRAIDTGRIGTLSHPTKGTFQAAITLVDEKGDPQVRNGLMLVLTWVEHNNGAALLVADVGTQRDAPATTQARADAADAAMVAADPGASYTLTRPVVDTQLAVLETATAANFAAINAALRTMRAVASGNMARPAFAGVSGHFAARTLAALRASIGALRSRYLPDAARVREYVPTAQMADWEVARAVYGAAKYSPLIRQANSVPDFGAIAPGTRLVILPLPSSQQLRR